MAGHSKWDNIKRRKEAVDAKRGKVFTKLSQQITIAAKQGGGDPEKNSSLRLAISKAKEANMPKDKIQKAVEKAEGGGVGLTQLDYEFYGPSGVAVIVKTFTDNKNRTASSVKAILNKHNITLGNPGSASYIFNNEEPSFKIDLNPDDKKSLQSLIEEFQGLDEVEEVITNAQ